MITTVATIIGRASVRMSERDALRHAEDMMRTSVEPGADPRAACLPFSWKYMRSLLESRPRAVAEVRGEDGSLRCVVMDDWRARVDRVVPEDLARWRDPDHRQAIEVRARAYATERATYPRGGGS